MKKLLSIIIAFVAILGMSSCSEEAVDVDTVNKQTILVFMPWTGSSSSSGLYNNFINNLDSIKQGIVNQKGLTNTRVLVFISKPSSTGGYGKSYLYELKYDTNQKTVDEVELNTYEGNSYTTAEGITSLINEVKSRAEALNYAMIIGSHGCGWTYVDDWKDYPYYAKKYAGMMADDSTESSAAKSSTPAASSPFDGWDTTPTTRFLGSVSQGDYAIDVPTLAQGIEASGIKMQYILLDACYMSNVETAYELRNATNYLVASASEIMSIGMPYASIWTSLNSAAPNYSGIVSGFNTFYSSYEYPYGNLAAIDCRQMEKLAAVMKDINQKYPTIDSDKLAGVQKLGGFQPTIFYDLGNYIDSLVPTGYMKEQFTNQLKLTVKASQSTSKVLTALYSDNELIDVNTFSGLTISDPSTHSAAVKGREKTGWWKATHNE